MMPIFQTCNFYGSPPWPWETSPWPWPCMLWPWLQVCEEFSQSLENSKCQHHHYLWRRNDYNYNSIIQNSLSMALTWECGFCWAYIEKQLYTSVHSNWWREWLNTSGKMALGRGRWLQRCSTGGIGYRLSSSIYTSVMGSHSSAGKIDASTKTHFLDIYMMLNSTVLDVYKMHKTTTLCFSPFYISNSTRSHNTGSVRKRRSNTQNWPFIMEISLIIAQISCENWHSLSSNNSRSAAHIKMRLGKNLFSWLINKYDKFHAFIQ